MSIFISRALSVHCDSLEHSWGVDGAQWMEGRLSTFQKEMMECTHGLPCPLRIGRRSNR